MGHDLKDGATLWDTPDLAQEDSCRVKSPTSGAATPCHSPARKTRASHCLTLLESTDRDRWW
eukprot:356037-Pleurochrysis_carterae.AAC.1